MGSRPGATVAVMNMNRSVRNLVIWAVCASVLIVAWIILHDHPYMLHHDA